MKVLQFMASPKYVGAERSFVELSNELSKSEEVVALVVKGCEYKDRFSKNVQVIELSSNPNRNNPWLYMEIAKILHTFKPDIVHAHSAKATQILYRLWKFMRFPFVATKRNSSKKAKIFDKVPVVVGVSKEVLKSIDNPNKYLIYNGIEPRELPHIPKENIFAMIAIGILQPRKGFAELIKACKGLSFDFQLWIVGEGEQRSELEKLIKKEGMQDKVFLLGQREDVEILQAKSHLQIINSKREGLSRVLIEGLFYSDAIISTKVAGSTEILPDELLFENAMQKIEEVYREYNKYKEIFRKTKERYQPLLQLSRVAKEYKELYKKASHV